MLLQSSAICAIAVSVLAAAAAAQQLPRSSTLPRAEYKLNNTYIDVATHGWGSWRLASPHQVLPAGPIGTVPTAQVAYICYLDKNAQNDDVFQFRRSIDGGMTWGNAQTLYTGFRSAPQLEVFAAGETQLLAFGHEVYLVFASDRHNLGGGAQGVWALGSLDQGQTWSAPVLLSTGVTGNLFDVDYVEAAVSSGSAAASGCLNVVYNADYQTSGVNDLFFVQAQIQNGQLAITVPETRLNHAVAAATTDVTFDSIAADGPVIHVAWTDDRAQAGANQYDCFSITSLQNGSDFATVTEHRHTQMTAPLSWAAPRHPWACVDIPNVYTFMEDSRNGQDDCIMDWSSDLGMNWSATGVVVNTATFGSAGDIDNIIPIARGGRVAVCYVDDRLNGVNNNNNNQAVVAVSYNAGADFVAGTHTEVPLSLINPTPIVRFDMIGDQIAAIFESTCGSGEDFNLAFSSDGGRSFTDRVVTSFGGCGLRPGGVDVDNPDMVLTANGDCLVTWIDDRGFQGAGTGNASNNLFVSGIHYPELIDLTAQLQGLSLMHARPASAGDLALVLLSGTGTSSPYRFDNLGFSLNLTPDFWTTASISLAASAPIGPLSINLKVVDPTGSAQFPLIPNVSTLFGLPFWAAGITYDPVTGFDEFTDPIRF